LKLFGDHLLKAPFDGKHFKIRYKRIEFKGPREVNLIHAHDKRNVEHQESTPRTTAWAPAAAAGCTTDRRDRERRHAFLERPLQLSQNQSDGRLGPATDASRAMNSRSITVAILLVGLAFAFHSIVLLAFLGPLMGITGPGDFWDASTILAALDSIEWFLADLAYLTEGLTLMLLANAVDAEAQGTASRLSARFGTAAAVLFVTIAMIDRTGAGGMQVLTREQDVMIVALVVTHMHQAVELAAFFTLGPAIGLLGWS
jgi:hypothetical protein